MLGREDAVVLLVARGVEGFEQGWTVGYPLHEAVDGGVGRESVAEEECQLLFGHCADFEFVVDALHVIGVVCHRRCVGFKGFLSFETKKSVVFLAKSGYMPNFVACLFQMRRKGTGFF